ncbi:MAG TPA: hypothetical protein VFA10_05760 [Ktedonobacteraceae bacterium]|nr:hypothetical protein [Ktedonobacteraceae bacterium]
MDNALDYASPGAYHRLAQLARRAQGPITQPISPLFYAVGNIYQLKR